MGQSDFGGFDPDQDRPQAVRTFCSPGERRCLAENSPLSERCGERGVSWERDTCDAGQICHNRQCIEFSCVPARAICVGTDARATCSPNAREVQNVVTCEDDEICRAGACIDPCAEAAREGAYIGCDYVSQRLFNLYQQRDTNASGNAHLSPFAIIAANPSRFHDARVTITNEHGQAHELLTNLRLVPDPVYQRSESTTVSSAIMRAGEPLLELDGEARLVRIPPDSAAVLLLAPPSPNESGTYKITTTRPVVAYQFSPYCCNFTATNDASLLLPTASMGTRYRVFSYPTMFFQESLGFAGLDPYFYVVALEDETTIKVTDREPLTLASGDFDPVLLDSEIDQQGTSITFTADALERRVFTRSGDLSGALVESDKPVAVFVGHPCTFVPQEDWACDHLEEQLLPATTLGKNYLLPTFRLRNEPLFQADRNREGIYWRLVAEEDARVTLSPSLQELELYEPSTFQTQGCLTMATDGVIAMQAGDVCELGLKGVASLSSTGALAVAGVLSGHQSTGQDSYGTQAGDPSLFTAPPVEQYRRDYTFVTPPTFKKTFASIVAPEGAPVSYRGELVPDSERLDRQLI
ncbi:unnamed protein product, partial [Laminaria digitata]